MFEPRATPRNTPRTVEVWYHNDALLKTSHAVTPGTRQQNRCVCGHPLPRVTGDRKNTPPQHNVCATCAAIIRNDQRVWLPDETIVATLLKTKHVPTATRMLGLGKATIYHKAKVNPTIAAAMPESWKRLQNK